MELSKTIEKIAIELEDKELSSIVKLDKKKYQFIGKKGP